MSDFFDVRTDSPTVRNASLAFVNAFLAETMPSLTLAARGCGYAIAVHGSRCRDIDMLAVPWTSQAQSADFLCEKLCGTLAGFTGRAIPSGDWSDRPHGRRSRIIILPGMCPEIDLSVMPRATPPQGTDHG